MENLQGALLKGYKLEESIGDGGFGAVYRAQQTTIGREVAIKIILPKYANNPDFIRRFEAEAHIIARLEHPHITPLYDFWRDPSGAYLVMRHLRGGSVRDALESGRYELHAVSQLLDQIASALDFAHRNNVIHRDIKPGNILLDEEGNTYLADFGIAKDLAGITDNGTAADAVVGSLDYISPEQARSEAVTPRTDIYSLGVTLYEIITGEHPFKNASTIERLYKHINDPLPDMINLPDNVRDVINEIIQKATAKNPEERYPDVLAMAIAFSEGIGRSSTQEESIVEQLTLREQEILALITKGMSNREIADMLVVTLGTVKWHINQLYKKLGVRSRVQAIVRARELNLIVTGDTADYLPNMDHVPTAISLPEPENPYKGLHAFQMTDARDFFGRDELSKKLIDKMCDDDPFNRFIAVVGPSGSGKSSLVKAGLIPALWRGIIPNSEKWFVVDMIPGTHPLDKLEVALMRVAAQQTGNLREQLQRDERGLLRVADLILPSDDTELVIVVDQFEEIFTLVEDEKDRQHFLNLLRFAVSDVRSRVRVIVTLRADYYDRPLHYPEFGELIRSRMETILPLSAKGLERAIRGPAERVGVTFEQGLVEQIVSAMNYQAGALPLLQYALTELFDRRKGRLLTNKAYADIGGAVGALANRADEIYRSMSDEVQELAQQIFMRLVTLGEGAEDTRRRTTRSELLSLTDNTDLMEEIIDQFAAYRLLSLDHDPDSRQPTVEVAHEAILREWDRLRQWLNESRDDIRQEQAVSRAAEDWKKHNQDKSYLLRGARLEQVEKWQLMTTIIQTPLERDFVAESLEQREIEAHAESTRQEREERLEKRSQNFLRGLVAVFAIATIIAGGLSILAFSLNNQSQQSAAEFRSVALTFGAQDALNNGQSDVALALAQEAINMDNPPFAAEQMFFNASSSSWIKQRFLVSDTRVWDAIYHPDGKRIITTSWDGRAIVWDIETGEELQSIQREGRPLHVTVHPDGNLLAVGGRDGLLQLWNLETNDVREFVVGEDDTHMTPTFTRDGTLMLTGTHDSIINVWDMETLSIIRSFEAHEGRIQAIYFNSDESLLITSAGDALVKIWDFETDELVQVLDHHNRGYQNRPMVWDAQFLPDNERVLSVDSAGMIILWDWRSGEIIWTVENPVQVQDMAFSPDGETVVVGFDHPYSQAHLLDVETGKLIRVYEGHSERVNNVDYSPDGKNILTGSLDGTVIIWPVNWEGARMTVSVPAAQTLVWHPTRRLVAVAETISSVGTAPDTIRLLDIDTGEIVQELEGHRQQVFSLAFTLDGRYLLSGHRSPDAGSSNTLVHVWNIETGEQHFTFDRHIGAILDIAISPNGRIAAIGEGEGARIVLWDVTTGERLRELEEHQDWVMALVFSPNGQYLYSGGRDGSLFKWDVQTGKILMKFDGHPILIRDIDASNDGTRLISGSDDFTAIVWDTSTGDAMFTLLGHTGFIFDVEFSPDASTILTSSLDGTVILWDAQTGQRLRTYVATSNPLNLQAIFTPDGQTIISGANDMLTIWDASPLSVDLETWVTENRYIPDFTCEQRALYIIEPLCESEQ